MNKRNLIIAALLAYLVMAVLELGLFFFAGPLPGKEQEAGERPPYRAYLELFLAGSGYTLKPAYKNGFAYYELYSAGERLAGFVLHGTGEGWAGPLYLFVRTDTAGTIKQLHVWHHRETPLYVVDLDAFLSTFAGFEAEAGLEWQKDVHGITGATVTAEAIIAAVHQTGEKAYQKGIFTGRH